MKRTKIGLGVTAAIVLAATMYSAYAYAQGRPCPKGQHPKCDPHHVNCTCVANGGGGN